MQKADAWQGYAMRLLEQIYCYILCLYSISTYIYNVLVDIFRDAVNFRQRYLRTFKINYMLNTVLNPQH